MTATASSTELLYRAAARIEDPDDRAPCWLICIGQNPSGPALAAWLRSEAVFTSPGGQELAEAVEFARTVVAAGRGR